MTRPLRVLLITGEYPPMQGGVADFSRILAAAMVAQGAEVHVLTAVEAGGGPRAACVRCYPRLASWGWRALYATARALVRELQPDVVNIQYQTAAYAMHPAINLLPAVLRDVPCVVTFHDLKVPYLFPKAGALRRWANLALARLSRAAIATNAQDHATLATYRRLRRVELIPIGSNIVDVLPANYDRDTWRERWGVSQDTLLLCYFGFLNASKGGEELVEALHRLAQGGRKVALLMIGGAVGASDPTNRAYLDTVKRALRERDLEQQVIWTGYMPPEQVSASFHSADLCVLPYRDGASFRRGSLMAALAHGMVIVTTHPEVPLPELVQGENALLVPARDPQALADAVARLADDASLRERLGAGARALARQFDWALIAARTLGVFHAVIGH